MILSGQGEIAVLEAYGTRAHSGDVERFAPDQVDLANQ